jgi:hypothetical protein
MTVRWVFLSAAVLLSALVLLKGAPLVWILTEGGCNYILLVSIMTVILHRFSGTSMAGQELRERIGRLAVRGSILGSLYLLSVFAFAHTVYNHVPAEKGGGDFTNAPDATLCFLESARSSIPVGIAADPNRTPLCTFGVKIIEETPSTVYVAKSSDRGSYSAKDYPNAPVLWRSGLYYPVVFGLSKATVAGVVVMNEGYAEVSVPTIVSVPQSTAPGASQPKPPSVQIPVQETDHKVPKRK